jgi:hypothetical protein
MRLARQVACLTLTGCNNSKLFFALSSIVTFFNFQPLTTFFRTDLMNTLLKKLFLGSAVALALSSQVMAQTKVVIGHFGDPAPYKAIVADGTLEKATASIRFRCGG